MGALVAAAVLYLGMTEVAARLDRALAAEDRMARYSNLSTQVSTFLVIATEAVQTALPPDERGTRLDPVAERIRETFVFLHQDVERAVTDAQAGGLTLQSRFATQSLGLARMEALLAYTLRALREDTMDQPRLRAQLDSFASTFDPLLNQAVQTEVIFRNETLASIEDLRSRLTVTALALAVLASLAAVLFYFGLIRPQFARLDRLRQAARQIGQEDFALLLPDTRQDEIGALYSETNRMAEALAARQTEVRSEWDRLNQTIAARTEELRHANQRLEEIDENRRRFFADVSHELRTPLTVILMEAQIGKAGGDKPQAAFATIETRAARLNRRIDDLLRVARSDSGQLVLDPQPMDLASLIDAVTEETDAELETAGIKRTQSDMPQVTLLGDPNWTRQILVGLIRNVIRHARDGGALHLEARAEGGTLALTLRDNGPGVPAEAQATLFDRFAQAGQSQSQGFGIGLALARWVVAESGGTITLQSPVPRATALGDGPGTELTLRLPLVTDGETPP